MPKNEFPDYPELGLKIKRHQDTAEERRKKFVLLCQYYGMDRKNLNSKDVKPWQALCYRMIPDLVPGFQVSNSGNKRRNSLRGDMETLEIYDPTTNYFDEEKKVKEWYSKPIGERLRIAAKKEGSTSGKVKAAMDRFNRMIKKYGEAAIYDYLYGSGKIKFERKDIDYITAEPDPNRHNLNRKIRNRSTD